MRSVGILVGYLGACVGLTATIVRSLCRQPGVAGWRGLLFALLAASSLGTTWYYMLQFFRGSYREWGGEGIEEWLNHTSLFRVAWHTVVCNSKRYWWSRQIFLATAIWSLFLGVEGRRLRIGHAWVYMVLGQIVAISFAQNLFFLSVLGGEKRERKNVEWVPFGWVFGIIYGITFAGIVMTPYVEGRYFLPVLLAPHVALLVPPLLGQLPRRLGYVPSTHVAVDEHYARIFRGILLISILLHGQATLAVLARDRPAAIIKALFEHPAMSSVGWDVIFFGLSASLWAIIQGWNGERIVRGRVFSTVDSGSSELSSQKQRQKVKGYKESR